MLVKSQDGKTIYNIGQAYRVYVAGTNYSGYSVEAEFPDGRSVDLGTYKEERTAREELNEIYYNCTRVNHYTMPKDCER